MSENIIMNNQLVFFSESFIHFITYHRITIQFVYKSFCRVFFFSMLSYLRCPSSLQSLSLHIVVPLEVTVKESMGGG